VYRPPRDPRPIPRRQRRREGRFRAGVGVNQPHPLDRGEGLGVHGPALLGQFLGLADEERSHEADDGSSIPEDPDHIHAPVDLLVHALLESWCSRSGTRARERKCGKARRSQRACSRCSAASGSFPTSASMTRWNWASTSVRSDWSTMVRTRATRSIEGGGGHRGDSFLSFRPHPGSHGGRRAASASPGARGGLAQCTTSVDAARETRSWVSTRQRGRCTGALGGSRGDTLGHILPGMRTVSTRHDGHCAVQARGSAESSVSSE